MEYLHIRYTAEKFPQILGYFESYVLVSHQQSSFHYHLVGKPNCSIKTIRNNLKGGNKICSSKVCDFNMYNYLFHPGSNYELKQKLGFSDEQIQEFVDSSEEYYQSLQRKDKDDIVDIIYNRVKDKNLDINLFYQLEHFILRELFIYCMENKKLPYNRMLQKQYTLAIVYKFNPELALHINENWAKFSRSS